MSFSPSISIHIQVYIVVRRAHNVLDLNLQTVQTNLAPFFTIPGLLASICQLNKIYICLALRTKPIYSS